MTPARYSAVQLGPDNRPSTGTVLLTEPDEGRGIPPAILALWRPGEVAVAWSAPETPIRRLGAEALGSVRRKRLWRRLERQCPLLASYLYEAELAKRPRFFAGDRESGE